VIFTTRKDQRGRTDVAQPTPHGVDAVKEALGTSERRRVIGRLLVPFLLNVRTDGLHRLDPRRQQIVQPTA